jgi:hypothetical protein
MKFKDVGFRGFYHRFIAVPANENLKKLIENFPGSNEANYILTYGYIDHSAGFTLEVIAAAVKSDGGFEFKATNPELSAKIRIANVLEDEAFYFKEEDLSEHYAYKLDQLQHYNVNDAIERSRSFEFLDRFRNLEFPDDIFVYFIKEGNEVEKCMVRIENLSDHIIFGTLLNEPEQDFGYHEGDNVEFILHQAEEDTLIPVLKL